jgi:hypothetical protein
MEIFAGKRPAQVFLASMRLAQHDVMPEKKITRENPQILAFETMAARVDVLQIGRTLPDPV